MHLPSLRAEAASRHSPCIRNILLICHFFTLAMKSLLLAVWLCNCRMVLLPILRYNLQLKEAKSHVLFLQEILTEELCLNRPAEFKILLFCYLRLFLCMKVFTNLFCMTSFCPLLDYWECRLIQMKVTSSPLIV